MEGVGGIGTASDIKLSNIAETARVLVKSLVLHIRVEHALLLQVMGHGVLGQKGRLQSDFGADPFAFGMGGVGRMVAASAAAELGTEVRALKLIELLDLLPGGIADRAGDVDFKLENGHKILVVGR